MTDAGPGRRPSRVRMVTRRGRARRTSRGPQAAAALALALAALAPAPGAAIAHPLGNFTVNHYAGLHIEPERVLLDVVIDEAEIPAFQRRQAIDTDADGSVSDEEIAAGAVGLCRELAPSLELTVDAERVPANLLEAGLSFPLGSGGLNTMRLACGFEAPLPSPIGAGRPTRIGFADTSRPDQLGWREIVVVGDGVAVAPVAGEIRVSSPSKRLTVYPDAMVLQPLADTDVLLDAIADPGATAPAFDVPDADPIGGAAAGPAAGPTAAPSFAAGPALIGGPSPVAAATTTPAPTAVRAAVPGGIGGEVPSIFAAADLTPLMLLLSIATAALLGAGHALTPGHGKTLMAAYLVGTRGSPLHALGLGLSVSLSHTAGILVLAAIVVGAADILPPDLVVRTAPVIAALSILGIGAWMLAGEWRRRRAMARARHDAASTHAPGTAKEHEHGGLPRAHPPNGVASTSWRGLFALGLAGGLIPSTSALLILLGAIAAGRPGFGFVLVVAFGVGMAAVLAGVGLAVVLARARLDRLPPRDGLGGLREAVPLAAAILVLGFGIYLTAQAIVAAPTL